MTREEFISLLEKNYYSYEIAGEKVIVTHGGYVDLRSLNSLPSDVEFKNVGGVYLGSLEILPSGVEFKNVGDVLLRSLETIASGVEFKNFGDAHLNSLKTIYPDVKFNNEGSVYCNLFDGWFSGSKLAIKDINSNNLLNLMIKRGIFE